MLVTSQYQWSHRLSGEPFSLASWDLTRTSRCTITSRLLPVCLYNSCVKGPIASTPSSCALPNMPKDAFTKMIKNQQEIATDRWHRRECLSGEPVGLVDAGES